jgi:tetratricopeptide (TPR) repeat protein
MSLIIDALKKAQQLRLKEPERPPILKYPHPENKKRRNSKNRWIFTGTGLISFCIILFVFLIPAPQPLAPQINRTIVPIERIQSEALLNKEEPTEEPHNIETSLSGLPSSDSVTNKIPQEPQKEVLDLKKIDQSLIIKKSEEEKIKPLKKTITKKSSTPILPYTQNEEAPSKSFEVEKQDRLGHAFEERDKENLSGSALNAQPESFSQDSGLKLETKGKPKQPSQGAKGLNEDILNHFNSGIHFYNQKEFSKAVQAYQKVIELDPTYVEAYNNLGITYQMIGDTEKAFNSYEKAIKINPGYEKGYNNLGILLLLKDRYGEALEAFQKALAINSNNIESHINLGILFKKSGRLEKAIESYQTALSIDPLHRETHYNIALLHEQIGNFETAINHYQQFIQLSLKSHPELVTRVQRHLNGLIGARGNKR